MAKNGTATLDKREKQLQRERREVERLERELARPQGPSYLYYLLLIICVVYITDEVATQIRTQMQMVIAQVLFAPVYGAEYAVARMGVVGTITMIGAPLSILYKPLSDRLGRRVFLIINTFGMGVGLFIISLSTNIPVYLIGSFFVGFFIPHDVQAVYILETVPAKRRASIYSAIKAVATLGMFLIPLLRSTIMGDDITKWRGVFIVPAIIAAGISVFALLAVRETTPFIKKRLEYLAMGIDERESLKKEKNAEHAQGGVISAIKFVMSHKQLKWLLLGGGFVLWGASMTGSYETIITYGYAAEHFAGGMDFEQAHGLVLPVVTQALFLFPFGSAFFQFIQGFFADKFGRKPTIIIMSLCALVSYSAFFIGTVNYWNPYLVGLFCGCAVGSYWATLDLAGGIMTSESTPTNMRASVMSVQPVMSLVFAILPMLGGLIIQNVLGDAFLGIITIVIAIPGMLTGMLIILFKVRETKGVNLEEVTGNE